MYIKASQPQYTPAGKLLGSMYYGSFLQTALSSEQYSGYPHNGGEHTLSLTMSPADVGAFLEIIKETYPHHPGTEPFCAHVQAQLPQGALA